MRQQLAQAYFNAALQSLLMALLLVYEGVIIIRAFILGIGHYWGNSSFIPMLAPLIGFAGPFIMVVLIFNIVFAQRMMYWCTGTSARVVSALFSRRIRPMCLR
jgi:hypothetical protein